MLFDSALQILTSGIISALVTMWINYGIEHHRRQQDALMDAFRTALNELDTLQDVSSQYWLAGADADQTQIMRVISASSNFNSAISVFEEQIDDELFFELSDAVTGGSFAEPQTEPNEDKCLAVIEVCGRVRTLFHNRQIELVREKYWLFRYVDQARVVAGRFLFPK